MSEIASARINTFGQSPKTDFVPTSEQTITGQLPAIIQKAIEPLLDRISSLEAVVASQEEKIAALESRASQQEDNGLIQLRLIKDLRDEVHKEPEPPATTKKPAQKTQDNITRIAVILAAKEKRLIEGQAPWAYVDRLRKEGMTFSQLANIMGLTVDRIRQLSRIAATDQRFNITWHPRKKNTKIFKLRRWDVSGL